MAWWCAELSPGRAIAEVLLPCAAVWKHAVDAQGAFVHRSLCVQECLVDGGMCSLCPGCPPESTATIGVGGWAPSMHDLMHIYSEISPILFNGVYSKVGVFWIAAWQSRTNQLFSSCNAVLKKGNERSMSPIATAASALECWLSLG